MATAEFLSVDVETNGQGGEMCELTEVGTVLVGGGEPHEGWAAPRRLAALHGRAGRRGVPELARA